MLFMLGFINKLTSYSLSMTNISVGFSKERKQENISQTNTNRQANPWTNTCSWALYMVVEAGELITQAWRFLLAADGCGETSQCTVADTVICSWRTPPCTTLFATPRGREILGPWQKSIWRFFSWRKPLLPLNSQRVCSSVWTGESKTGLFRD